MIVIGIISVPKKNSKIYKRYFKPASIKDSFGTHNKYLVAELSVSAKQMRVLSERRINKIIKYAEKILKNNGSTHIILSKECKAILLNTKIIERFNIKKTNKIPPNKILDAFKYCIEKIGGFNENSTLLIRDINLNFINYNIIESLCKCVKYITLHTQKIEDARIISQKLFYEYGMLINITDNKLISKAFYIIDFDRCIVRAGDFTINGAEFISGASDYLIDAEEEAACLGEENELFIKNWFSGKNKLKIS